MGANFACLPVSLSHCCSLRVPCLSPGSQMGMLSWNRIPPTSNVHACAHTHSLSLPLSLSASLPPSRRSEGASDRFALTAWPHLLFHIFHPNSSLLMSQSSEGTYSSRTLLSLWAPRAMASRRALPFSLKPLCSVQSLSCVQLFATL